MSLLQKIHLKSHDVFEFCYAKEGANHWSEESLFLMDVVPYLSQVFSQFDYYKCEKVTLNKWEKVKHLVLEEKTENESLLNFFNQIDEG